MKIDFVILWVDGNDPKWLKQKNKYLNIKGDSSKNRFRDCNNLQYLFRGIEEYASWVNNIYFITWGHLPNWLNVKHPKIKVVKHEEFIPKKYLPTFNSNVIELNLHRIKDLSEHFVLFNDDLFILNNLKQEDFFNNYLPNDVYIEFTKKKCSARHKNIRSNYLKIINKYFNKKECIKNNLSKILNRKYGLGNFKTIFNLKKPYSDFISFHLTQSCLKSTFKTVWAKETKRLSNSCFNKFRAESDIGRGIFRYWNLLEGKFFPYKSLGNYYVMKDDNKDLVSVITNRKHKIICINDTDVNIDFEKAKNEINEALNSILPKKSSFEK